MKNNQILTFMNYIILFSIIFILRLSSLFKSISNEKKLLASGAVQYGKLNSTILTILHILIYFSSLYEAVALSRSFNVYTYSGLSLYAFSIIILWIVIWKLKDIWTVKLYIAPTHPVNKSFIFKYFRHPNYFLNIIPELIGLTIAFQAWNTLIFGLPVYMISLTVRIIQEERIMKEKLPDFD